MWDLGTCRDREQWGYAVTGMGGLVALGQQGVGGHGQGTWMLTRG